MFIQFIINTKSLATLFNYRLLDYFIIVVIHYLVVKGYNLFSVVYALNNHKLDKKIVIMYNKQIFLYLKLFIGSNFNFVKFETK